MPKHPSAGVKTDRVKGKDINGQMVILERTQPRQLSLFQTFLPDEERYSNTIDLYDALPKYFSNHTIMRSLRKSGQYLPVLKREFEHKGAMYVLYVRLNPLVTACIDHLPYRQFSYILYMEYTHRLSRWLYKRLAHNYVQASLIHPYAIKLSTILRDSGTHQSERGANNLREIKKALE